MNRREIAALACKIISLYLFVQVLSLSGAFVFLFMGGLSALSGKDHFRGFDLVATAMAVVPAVAYLVAGIVLWRKADGIASRMTSEDPTPVTRTDITGPGVMMIALVVVGIFVLITGLRSIVNSLVLFARYKQYGEYTGRDLVLMPKLWSGVLGFVIGLVVILGRRGLTNLLYRVRTAGINQRNASDDE